jgi:hypothetical protein
VSVSSRFPVRKATPAGRCNMTRMDSMMTVIHNYDTASDAAALRPESLTTFRYSININYNISISIDINLHKNGENKKENSVTKD